MSGNNIKLFTNSPMVLVGNTGMPYAELVYKLEKRFPEEERLEICHAALGIATEANETADVLKSHAIYGKELDIKALVKELGDVYFWMQAIRNRFNITEAEIVQGNADKLAERYNKLQYSNEAAIARVDKKYVVWSLATNTQITGPYEHEYEVNKYIEDTDMKDIWIVKTLD